MENDRRPHECVRQCGLECDHPKHRVGGEGIEAAPNQREVPGGRGGRPGHPAPLVERERDEEADRSRDAVRRQRRAEAPSAGQGNHPPVRRGGCQ